MKVAAMGVVLVITCAAWPGGLRAQETEAANLTPKKVYLKADAAELPVFFGDTFESVFTPTMISCPGGGTCTVRVQVSGFVAGIDDNEAVHARVLIDGVEMQPGAMVWEWLKFGNASTLTWIAIGVGPGWHTVDVQFRGFRPAPPIGAYIGQRVLSIDVLKP